MRILSVLLIGAMLLMAACGGDEAPTPTAAAPVTPTAAVVQNATPDTPTAEATTAMTDTTTMTDTTDMTDTMEMTDTTSMTETGGMTETGNLTTTDTAVGTTAIALLQDAEGNAVGQATFTEDDSGVTIQVELQELTVAGAGEHGLHLHTTGACTPDFQAAGGHFNPTGAQHGIDSPRGPHAGDLPNIVIDADGNATYETTNAMITLGEGNNSLFDSDGSAIVVHAGPDDMVTDPAGDSGDRIACGVIEQQ